MFVCRSEFVDVLLRRFQSNEFPVFSCNKLLSSEVWNKKKLFSCNKLLCYSPIFHLSWPSAPQSFSSSSSSIYYNDNNSSTKSPFAFNPHTMLRLVTSPLVHGFVDRPSRCKLVESSTLDTWPVFSSFEIVGYCH